MHPTLPSCPSPGLIEALRHSDSHRLQDKVQAPRPGTGSAPASPLKATTASWAGCTHLSSLAHGFSYQHSVLQSHIPQIFFLISHLRLFLCLELPSLTPGYLSVCPLPARLTEWSCVSWSLQPQALQEVRLRPQPWPLHPSLKRPRLPSASHLRDVLGDFRLHVVSLLIHFVHAGVQLSAQVLEEERSVCVGEKAGDPDSWIYGKRSSQPR